MKTLSGQPIRWCCIDRLSWHDLSGISQGQTIDLRRPAPAAWRANRHAKLPASPPSSPSLLRLDLFGGSVPHDRGSAEIRLIGHVARQRSMVAEYHIFDNWLAGTH